MFEGDYGEACKAHMEPECAGASPPEWCASPWCYVDPYVGIYLWFITQNGSMMNLVNHVSISGASAQSLGVDTRRPNGEDHWWDTHGKREKRNKRRQYCEFHFVIVFPPLLDHAPRGAFFIDVERI